MTGIPQNKHLEKIEDDQSLNGINSIDDTIRNEAGRHWFVSQAIQPNMQMGYYSPTTGRFTLGGASWRDNMTCEMAFTTASAAASTLTCATGHRYEVTQAGAMNASQASTTALTITKSGSSTSALVTTSSGTTMQNAIGNGAGTATAVSFVGPVWLDAGDTLTLTLNTYAGGNDTEHYFMYNDYTL